MRYEPTFRATMPALSAPTLLILASQHPKATMPSSQCQVLFPLQTGAIQLLVLGPQTKEGPLVKRPDKATKPRSDAL
jgi:hypothetical protein